MCALNVAHGRGGLDKNFFLELLDSLLKIGDRFALLLIHSYQEVRLLIKCERNIWDIIFFVISW